MCRWSCGHSEENPFCWTACDAASDLFELQTDDPCDKSDKTVRYKRNVYSEDEVCWTCTNDPEGRITPKSLAEVTSGEEADDELEEGEITETSEPDANRTAEAYLEPEDSEMIHSHELPASPKEWVNPTPKWPEKLARRNRPARNTSGCEPYYRVKKPESSSGTRKNMRAARKTTASTPKSIYHNKVWIGWSIKAARRLERPNRAGNVVDEALLFADYSPQS